MTGRRRAVALCSICFRHPRMADFVRCADCGAIEHRTLTEPADDE